MRKRGPCFKGPRTIDEVKLTGPIIYVKLYGSNEFRYPIHELSAARVNARGFPLWNERRCGTFDTATAVWKMPWRRTAGARSGMRSGFMLCPELLIPPTPPPMATCIIAPAGRSRPVPNGCSPADQSCGRMIRRVTKNVGSVLAAEQARLADAIVAHRQAIKLKRIMPKLFWLSAMPSGS